MVPSKPEDVSALFAAGWGGRACGECVVGSCVPEVRACLDAESCAQHIDCLATCRDPACIDRCDSNNGGWSNTAQGPYEALVNCLTGVCTAPCRVGQVFDCADHFDWGSSAGSVTAVVSVYDFLGFAPIEGASVRECAATSSTCDGPFFPTDSGGTATVPASNHVFGRLESYFEVQKAEWDPVLWYRPGAPVSRAYVSAGMVPRAYYASAASSLGVTDDPAKGLVAVVVHDCIRNLAPGISITVSPDTPGSTAWYGAVPVAVDAGRASTGADGLAGITGLAPGAVWVTAVREETQEVVAHARVWIRGGTRTWIWLPPRSNPAE